MTLTIKENVLSTMISHASNEKNRLLGTYVLSTGLNGAIESCRNADNDSFTVHA
jgi:hypothetical protein